VYKFCFSDSLPADYHVIISNLDENCDDTCSRLSSEFIEIDPETVPLRCDPRYMKFVNNCKVLSDHFSCDSCSNDFNSFAPSLKLDSNTIRLYHQATKAVEDDTKTVISTDELESKLIKGQCFTSSFQMLFNCDNRSPEYRRLCPCIKGDHKAIFTES